MIFKQNSFKILVKFIHSTKQRNIRRGALLWPTLGVFLRWQCFHNWMMGVILISCQ